MRAILASLLASALCGAAAAAQHAAFDSAPAKQTFEAQGLSFDAASIKAHDESTRSRPALDTTPAGIAFSAATPLEMVAFAFGVTRYQVSGPPVLRRARYDVVARAAGGVNDIQRQAMLQRLLVERFALTSHIEQRDARVFALMRTGGAPRLRPAAPNQPLRIETVTDGIEFHGASMADLAAVLSKNAAIGLPVTESTQIEGRFDFTLRLLPGAAKSSGDGKRAVRDGGGGAFRDALADLGLMLESRTQPLPHVIVDSIAAAPTDN